LAQNAAPEILAVAGGIKPLLGVVGLPLDLPRSRALVEVIRVVYEVPEDASEDVEARLRRLRRYLREISDFEQARVAFGIRPVSLSLANNRESRRLLERLAEAVGATLERRERVYCGFRKF